MLHECPHCDYKSTKAFNVKRHTIRNHKIEVRTPNIENQNKPVLVANIAENVSQTAENVALFAENVALFAENVAHSTTNAECLGKCHQCSQCLRYFTRKHSLLKHNEICKGCSPLQCEICRVVFNNRSAKHKHKKKGGCVPPPSVEPTVTNITNNISNNTTNIYDNSQHIHVTNFVCFNTNNNDPIEFNTAHMDNPTVLKPIFAQEDFSNMFGSFADAVFEAPENQIVHKNNMSRDFSTVYIQETGKWERKMDQQVYHKVARGISTSALTLSEKHKRKAPLSSQHRENLRDIAIDCEFSPCNNYEDEGVGYHKKTRDTIRMIKMKTHSNTIANKSKNE